MLIRIVRMTFKKDHIGDFLAIFHISKHQIRAFPGCRHLELLRDLNQPHIFITYSYWESAEALEMYRQSELFRMTWAATKVLFAEKAQAFSAESMELVS